MIKQDVLNYVHLGIEIRHFQELFARKEKRAPGKGIEPSSFVGTKIEDLSPEQQESLKTHLQDAQKITHTLNLPISRTILDFAIDDPPRTQREFVQLINTIQAETHGRLFLYIPPDRSEFYEFDGILSPKAHEAFPSAQKELKEAGTCYATERYTACVFHSMRGVEIGLRILGTDLGVTFPDKPIELAEWQNIIEQADSIIRERTKGRSWQKDEDRKFYSQAAAQFRYFKDGWRIRAAHARETYTGSQAYSVLTHAREFFETLSERLRESSV